MAESTWSPSPAATSLATTQKEVAGYVLMPTDDEVLDRALQGIRHAINRLNTRTWNWALTHSTITFAEGTQEYDLDQTFKAPRNFALRDSSAVDRDRLQFLPWGTFLKECQWDASGTPQYYSVNNPNFFGKLRLDLSPDAAFVGTYPTGRLWYHRRVQYPASTGTALDAPSEVSSYIYEFACGYTADAYAVDKAAAAYGRSRELFNMTGMPAGSLVTDDCHGQQSDWE